jgi:ATP-binding cassette subfamily B protein RaxB
MEVILQAQASECGLACLAMAASHHGKNIGLRELRRKFSVSLKGVNLARLVGMAQQLGMQARALRVDIDDIGTLQTPCILHWDMNHFVVLKKVGRNKVTIIDPARGERTLTCAEFSTHFTGVAMELAPGADFQTQAPAPSIGVRQLTGRVTGLGGALGTILGLSVALQVFVILAPFFMQWVVDQVLVSADHDLLTLLGLGFGLVVLSQVAIGLLRGWSVIYLSSRLGLQWTGNVFAHLLKLPMDFFEKRHLGDVVSRMGAIQAIQRTLTTSFVEAVIDGLMAVVTLAMMLVYSWKLALVTFLAVALYLAIRTTAYRPLRNGTEQQLVAAAKQQSHLLESIRGMQALKVSGTQALREATYQGLMHDTVNRDVWLARLGLGFNSASQAVFGIERIAVIWIGATLAMRNEFSVGMLIAYLAYKDQFAQRVAALIDKWMEFRMLRLHGERLAEIALTAPEVDTGSEIEVALPAEASLVVENLSFRYADAEPLVIDDCTFEVRPGESLAIVGPSGCGKTTLLKLMLGLLEPTSGTIKVGGIDIHKLGLRNYRSMVGAVMQEDRLFAGSVAENIAFGEEAIDYERVEAAARLAAIHDEVAAMTMGYHSLIGDMGTTLSGGQKQRVILARALYRQPRMLFLDEATSHLDVRRERLVNAAVRDLKLTKIIIAHRKETIASADRVLRLADGKVEGYEMPVRPLHPAAAAAAVEA